MKATHRNGEPPNLLKMAVNSNSIQNQVYRLVCFAQEIHSLSTKTKLTLKHAGLFFRLLRRQYISE